MEARMNQKERRESKERKGEGEMCSLSNLLLIHRFGSFPSFFLPFVPFTLSFLFFLSTFYHIFVLTHHPVAVCLVSLERRRRGKWLKWTEILPHIHLLSFSSTSLPSSSLFSLFTFLIVLLLFSTFTSLSNLTWWLYASIKACLECEERERVRNTRVGKEGKQKEKKNKRMNLKWKMWNCSQREEEDNLLPDCFFKDITIHPLRFDSLVLLFPFKMESRNHQRENVS